MRIVSAVTPAGDQCQRCFMKNPLSFKACSRCGVVEHLRLHGLCTGCVAADQVDALLGDFDPLERADLLRLRATLIAAKPDSLLQWLSLSEGATALAEIAAGTCPSTHDSIERRLPGKDGDHLRGLLVTAGLLEPRDEHLIRLVSWLDKTLTTVENTHHRQIVRAYATWAEIGRLRRRLAGSPASPAQTTTIRRKVRAALVLLSWLNGDIPLAGCQQIDIDGYLADGNSERYLSGRFLQWAVRQGHAHAVEIPSWTNQIQTRPLGSEQRWALAERLLSDSSLEALDRIAGLLNLLYAQPFTVITRLTVAHIEVRDTGTYVLLGESPLLVPGRLATLIRDHLGSRGSYAVVGRRVDSPWLFPGTHPDRHLSAAQLGRRLRRIGVYSAPGRRAALLDLATQVPAAVIARTLGISARVASGWTSDGGWAAYAAEVQRRPSTPPNRDNTTSMTSGGKNISC
ncbi:hypothetical protein OHA40_30625 [Nocardia sp. NBC_00508]|uniref:hypothetical protein n=1 Tax=Nocardia sp. NBC_00508 TaxID=2975992 RepID=UPI002E803E7E|nr:hypothetical protein [Nocardia sp. NBC_00508]WUD65898.1 hypothetical protein OHA40_30625 [Nocardia sp. NBC_00508]